VSVKQFTAFNLTALSNLKILLSWVTFTVEPPSLLLSFLLLPSREEMADCYERAAAIAVFQGNIRRGIASLKDGASVAKQKGDVSKSMSPTFSFTISCC
jgi:hypothetical protein